MTETTDAKEKPAKVKKGQGHFFAVDKSEWARICNLDEMNLAVSYLTLARGSLKDNVTTGWSARSIAERTAIAHKRAAKAIMDLENRGFLKTLRDEERTKALKNARGVYGPRFVGALRKGKSPLYRLRKLEKFDPIWIPNSLVDGAAGEVTPLERVRATSDVELLRLLIDLYSIQDLSGDGGISREILSARAGDESKHHAAEKSVDRLGEYGKHAAWRFSGYPRLTKWASKNPKGGEVFEYHWKKNPNDKEESPLWGRLDSLENLGLIEWVRYILNGDHKEGEPLFLWCVGENETPEAQSAFAAGAKLVELMAINDYASAKVHCNFKYGKPAEAYSHSNRFVPVPNGWKRMSVIDVARLRYWPNTKKNNAWYSIQRGRSEKLQAYYLEIRDYAQEEIDAVKQRKLQANG